MNGQHASKPARTVPIQEDRGCRAEGTHFSVVIDRSLPPTNNYDELAPVYDVAYGRDFCDSVAPVLARLIRQTIGGEPKRLLDLGCGSGLIMTYLGTEFGCRCYGIDASPIQIEQARRHISGVGIKAEFEVADICSVDYPDQCDAVTMTFDAVNHLSTLRRMKQVFKRVRQCLQPGGVFVFDAVTPQRLEMDTRIPEIIVRPNVTCVQCGLSIRHSSRWTRRRLFVQVIEHCMSSNAVHIAVLDHVAVNKNEMCGLLKEAGLSVRKVIGCRLAVGHGGPYMEGRNIFVARL